LNTTLDLILSDKVESIKRESKDSVKLFHEKGFENRYNDSGLVQRH
jgi:hypothetical protein